MTKFVSMLVALAAFAACGAESNLPTFTRTESPRVKMDTPLPNGGFEGKGGWESGNGAPLKLINDAHSGGNACRLNNSLVKTQLIPLAPGEELQFEAWTKVDDLRTISAEVAFFGDKRQWLKAGSAQLARGDQYSWQKIVGSFENTRSDVRYVSLQFYGSGVLDDVKLWKLKAAAATGDEERAQLKIDLPRKETAQMMFLANRAFEVWISRQTGMIVRLDSLVPTRKTIQPAGTNSMQLYLCTQEQPGVDGDFNRVVTAEHPAENELKFTLASGDPALSGLADATISYTLRDDRLNVSASVTPRKNDDRPFRLGLRSIFRANEWNRNIFMSWPVQTRPTATGIRTAFHYAPNDNSRSTIGISRYPCVVLEGTDRFLLWGNYDLGKFTCLSPNDLPWRQPSQQFNPKSLRAGETFRFDSVYAVFPKANHELTQVLRYYIDNVYSSLPLMKDLVKRQNFTGRYFTEGAFAWYHPGSVPLGQDGWRKAMLERHANNVWYSWWANWDECYPVSGEWRTYDTRPLSAGGVKAEIDYMKKMDLSVYLYFRQFLVEEGTFENRAPFKRWLGRDAEGKRMPFIDFKVPKPELLGGLKEVRWTMADFGAEDFREWYLKMVKRAIDFYQPTGIAWDMGYSSYFSHNAPEIGIGQGTLYVQGKIFEYLKEKYPDMRIAVNEAFCSPTALFGDAILIEGAWDVAKKSELDYQAARAYDATIFSLQLTDDYVIQGAPEIDLKPFTHLEVTARGRNLSRADLGFGDLLKNGFKADDTWQTVTVPLSRKAMRLTSVAVAANQDGNGSLEIAGAKFISDKNPKQTPRILFDNNTSADDFVMFGKWMHNRPTTGKVEQTEKGIRLTAEQPNGLSGGWLWITPVRQKWVKYNLKTLGLGAICSDAQVPALRELNQFSAKLAAMRHLSAKKLIYDAPQGVYGTFWARNEKSAGAIYNDTGKEQTLSLRLDRSAFPDNGAGLENGSVTMRMVDADGKMRQTDAFSLTPGENFLLLRGTIRPGSLLVIANW